MLKAVKKIFISEKDYAGRSITDMIQRFAAQNNTPITNWSYIREEMAYEDTVNGVKIYPHERAFSK